ncbi:MAG: thioredoxin [Selenomonadaceae bacterium]|nr:thioredoxin [Selenomonadaceae bacterium]
MNKIRILIALTAIGFMIYGVNRGELPLIFQKAIRICMECIGLG